MELLTIIGSCAVLGLPLMKGIRQQKRRIDSGENQLDHMTEGQFEEYLETMMGKLGYGVERPRYTDLLNPSSGGKAEKLSPTFIISTQKLTIAVCTQSDGEAINFQAAIAAQQRCGCDSAMIVCNNDVSEAVLSQARSEKVILWTKNDILKAARSSRCQSSNLGQATQVTDNEYSEERHPERRRLGQQPSQPQHLLA